MVQAELDPATAFEGARRTQRTLAGNTRFVAIDDEGQHGQYLLGPSSCAEDLADRFVFSGELPSRNRLCGTAPLPAESTVFSVNGPVDGNAVDLPGRRSVRSQLPNPMLQRVLDRVAANQR